MFNRISILSFAFPGRRLANIRASMAMRWSAAAEKEPRLVTDLIAMGGVFNQTPRNDGLPETDPLRLAYDAGRRDLTLELLALAGCTPEEINLMMMEANDVH